MLMTKYARGRVREGGKSKTGPDDAGWIVWALGDFFFFFVIFATNENFKAYITSNLQNMRQRSDRGWQWPKWPKRHILRRLGPRWVFFFFLRIYSICRMLSTKCMIWEWWRMSAMKTGPNNARCVIWAISKLFEISFVFKASGGQWLRKQAQTTPDMSFGRLVSVFLFLSCLINFNNYI